MSFLAIFPGRGRVWVIRSGEAERAWDRVKDTFDYAALEAFVSRFGETFYGDLARQKIAASARKIEKHRLAVEAEARRKSEDQRKREADAEARKRAEDQRLVVESKAKRKVDERTSSSQLSGSWPGDYGNPSKPCCAIMQIKGNRASNYKLNGANQTIVSSSVTGGGFTLSTGTLYSFSQLNDKQLKVRYKKILDGTQRTVTFTKQ